MATSNFILDGYAKSTDSSNPLLYSPSNDSVLRTKYLFQGEQADGGLMASCISRLPITISSDSSLLLCHDRTLGSVHVWYGTEAEEEIERQLQHTGLCHVNGPLPVELPETLRTQFYLKPGPLKADGSTCWSPLVRRLLASYLAGSYTVRATSPLYVFNDVSHGVVRICSGDAARERLRKLQATISWPLTAPPPRFPVVVHRPPQPAATATATAAATTTTTTTSASSAPCLTVVSAPAPTTCMTATCMTTAPVPIAATTCVRSADWWATTCVQSAHGCVLTARRGEQCKTLHVPPKAVTDYLDFYMQADCAADAACQAAVAASSLSQQVFFRACTGGGEGGGHVCLRFGSGSLIAAGEAARQLLYSLASAANVERVPSTTTTTEEAAAAVVGINNNTTQAPAAAAAQPNKALLKTGDDWCPAEKTCSSSAIATLSYAAQSPAVAICTATKATTIRGMDRQEVFSWVKPYVDAEDALLLYLQKVTGSTLVHATKQDWRDMGLRDGAILDLMHAVHN